MKESDRRSTCIEPISEIYKELDPRGLISLKTTRVMENGLNLNRRDLRADRQSNLMENGENIKEIMPEIQAEIVIERPEWMKIILKALEERERCNQQNLQSQGL